MLATVISFIYLKNINIFSKGIKGEVSEQLGSTQKNLIH